MKYQLKTHECEAVLFENPNPYPKPNETFDILGLTITKYPPPTDYGPCAIYWAECPVTKELIFPHPGKYLLKMSNGSYKVMFKKEFEELYEPKISS